MAEPSRELIICDFDGTISAIDTINYLCTRYTPDVFDELEGRLIGGDLTLEEVLRREIIALRERVDDLPAIAAREVPLREGFAEFVGWVDEAGHELVIVSSGFRQLIEPMLAAAGHDGITLVANDVDLAAGSGGVSFREGPTCTSCGQRCKRHDVASLRADRHPSTPVTFIGDGFSDLCGCREADRILAVGNLAGWLQRDGVPHHPFEDFHDVIALLQGA